MKRLRTDLAALGFAAFGGVALAALFCGDGTLSEADARAEAAGYLAAAPCEAKRQGARWVVSDGRDTAFLDARTGDLVEIEFAGR